MYTESYARKVSQKRLDFVINNPELKSVQINRNKYQKPGYFKINKGCLILYELIDNEHYVLLTITGVNQKLVKKVKSGLQKKLNQEKFTKVPDLCGNSSKKEILKSFEKLYLEAILKY